MKRSAFCHIHCFWLVLIVIVGLTGCESMVNDLDEKKLPRVQSKIVAECFLTPQSDFIEVRISESQPIFGDPSGSPRTLTDAVVVLLDDQSEITLPFIDSLDYYRIESNRFKIEAGKTYRLSVSHNGRKVSSECTVPLQQPIIKSYIIDSAANNPIDQYVTSYIKFFWDDFKETPNYYSTRGHLVIEETRLNYDPIQNLNSPYRVATTILLDYNYYNYLVSDKNLDDVQFESPVYKVNLPPNYVWEYKDENGNIKTVDSAPEIKRIQLEVLNVDEHYYKFHRSLHGSNNNDNPFAEPTIIYSNIKDGLGCFGAYNLGKIEINP